MGKSLFENDVIETPPSEGAGVTGEPEGGSASGNAGQSNTPPSGTTGKETPVETPPQKSWVEMLNEQYKTEFKTPEEVGNILSRAKKADEYEPKIKEWETKSKEYEQRIADYSSLINPLSYFKDEASFRAEQLRKQHPDKSPTVLQEIVTQDTKGMSELDVLIKNTLLENPDLKGGIEGAREIVYDSLGITEETPMTDLPTLIQNKMKVQAKQVLKAWDELKSTVKLPEIKTPEQIQADREARAVERSKLLTPFREDFSKLDEISEEIEPGEVFKYKLSDEDKKLLPDIFDTYMAKAGLEPTKENIEQLKYLSEAMLLRGNIKQIYKVIKGDVETREKAKYDKLLGNESPNNTRTGLDLKDESDVRKYNDENGLKKFFSR